MHSSFRILLILAISGLIIASCARHGSQPVAPDETISPPELAGNADVSDESNGNSHYLFAYNFIYIDPDGPKVEIIPVREGEIHLNILRFLEDGPCFNCFKIVGFNFPQPGYLDLSIQIDHPFDDLTYSVFDVRGIMMFQGSHEFPVAGKSTSDPAFGDGALLNPDGYTALYNGSTATAPAGALQKYYPGNLATPAIPNSDINGYKYFITDNPANNRNAFYADSSDTVTYSLKLPTGPFVLGYAVDANWWTPISTPVDDPLTDFDINANCPEPWRVALTEQPIGDGLTTAGGQTKLWIDIFDWQGKSTYKVPVIECPELFDGSLNASWVSDTAYYSTYEVILSNTKLASAGEYMCLVSVEPNENDPIGAPWLDLKAYQIIKLGVQVGGGPIPEIEPNDLITQATNLPTGIKGTGIITDPTDEYDFWKFTLLQPFKVVVWWHIISGTESGDLYLLDKDGQTISSSGYPTNHNYMIEYYLPPDTYYIELRQSYESASYEIWVDTTALSLNETEPNNDTNEADIFSSGSGFVGFLSHPLDEDDFWTFSFAQSSIVDLAWHIDDGTTGDAIYLIDKDLQTISIDEYATDQSFTIHAYLHPDQYYVKLHQSYGSCLYTLSVNTQAIQLDETEPNNSKETADLLYLENINEGFQIHPTDENDFWAVTIGQSGDYEVRWHILDGTESGSVALLDSAGSVIGSDEYPFNHYYTVQQPLSPGTYYIRTKQNYGTCYYEISIVKL
jgi:hypothetical protein